MSIEMATAFKLLAEQDLGLRADVLIAYHNGGYAAVAELAAGMGHAFDPADADTVMTASAGELCDLELDAIAGGKRARPALGPA